MSDPISSSYAVAPPPVAADYNIVNTRPTGGWISRMVERAVTQGLVAGISNQISQHQGIPQEKKELIYEALAEKMATGTIDTQGEAVQLNQMVQDMIQEFTQQMAEEAGAGATTETKKGGMGSGHWLVALAKALSAIAGEHLGKMVEKASAIGNLEFKEGMSDEEKGLAASQMSQLTAEMQAHGQMYKLVQEATTTSVKTIGEALTSTARKQ